VGRGVSVPLLLRISKAVPKKEAAAIWPPTRGTTSFTRYRCQALHVHENGWVRGLRKRWLRDPKI
jgi:hypothetical protein